MFCQQIFFSSADAKNVTFSHYGMFSDIYYEDASRLIYANIINLSENIKINILK